MSFYAKELSIYFHWPFCKSKCPYCDFYSKVCKDTDQDVLISDYLKQLDNYCNMLPQQNIVSIYFGGGTPSLITPHNISRILGKIDTLWGIPSACEISLEANPNTNHPNLFADLASAGINRLSLGVQSLDDKQLRFLGRTHDSKQALKAIDEVLSNFNNHSIDLMYALPDQSIDNWQTQLEKVCSFGLKHISLYQLTIEENTIFHRKGITPLDEDKSAQIYLLTEDYLATQNYNKYEVSNYCTPGFASRHNQTYWQGGNYIGIGQSAHGRLKIGSQNYALTNPLIMDKLAPEERATELIIMGLRLTSGINKNTFAQITGINFDNFINQNFKKKILKNNLLHETKSTIRVSKKGFLLLDYIIQGLCC